jgi:branched-chain amino acid transport system substrate-binding protein
VKPLRIVALALGLVLALAAAPPVTPAADPVQINVIFGMTGASGFIGAEAAKSLAVVEDTINTAGGIDGRPVKFVVQDDQSDARVAVQLANVLLAKNVPVILGPNPVAACSAVAPLTQSKAVMFCISAAYHPPPNTNLYVAGVSTVDQIVFDVRYLRGRGITKLASMTSVDANGVDADNALTLALKMPENKGVTLVGAEHFGVNDLTVDAQMSRIKSSGAQAVITDNNGTPLGLILHGYSNLGLDVPLVTANGALNETAMRQFATILPKEFLVSGSLSDGPDVVPPGPAKTAILSYIHALKRAGIAPDHAHSVAWDPALILIAALRKLGPDASAAQINAFIHNLHGWPGVSGVYDFRNGNPSGLDRDSLVMVRWSPEKTEWIPVSKPGGAPLGSK